MSDERINRPDDPSRCQGRAPDGGQCEWRKTPGYDKCRRCRQKSNAPSPNAYLAEHFKKRLTVECQPGEEIAMLRESLALVHSMIAAHSKLITDDATLLAYSPQLSRLLLDAEKITATLLKLEQQADLLLGKKALLAWAMQICQVVAERIEGKFDDWEDTVLVLGDEISQITVDATNEEGEQK